VLEHIKKQRVSNLAVEQIQRLISDQAMQAGDALPSERTLMERLGISRVSVREALRILEMMGIVEVLPGKGVYVADKNRSLLQPLGDWISQHRESLLEHFEVRLLIEPHAAGFAARRATPKTIAEIKKAWEKFNIRHAEGDLVGMIETDALIHNLIASAAGNRTIEVLMKIFSSALMDGWKASLRVKGRAGKSIREHAAIIQAIADGDEEAARMRMREHLEHAIKDLKAAGLAAES